MNVFESLTLTALMAFTVYATSQALKPTPVTGLEATRLDELAHADSALFARAGFNIVARTGSGACNDAGEMTHSGYFAAITDVTYILSKPGSTLSYKACAKHNYGRTFIAGLTSVEKSGPKP